MEATVTDRVFFDLDINGTAAGRVEVGLFGRMAPRTTANFRALCTGERGVGPSSGKPLHLKGSGFHRIVQGFMLQVGSGRAWSGVFLCQLIFERRGGLQLVRCYRAVRHIFSPLSLYAPGRGL